MIKSTQDFPKRRRGSRTCLRAAAAAKHAGTAIAVLPERYQKVVFLYYTNGMTMKEIGAILG
jgi:DNA-directed RNA polymerase specialized sigma subunit